MKSRGRAVSLGEYSVFFNLEVKDITQVLHLQNYKHITTIFYKEQYFFYNGTDNKPSSYFLFL